MVEPDVDTIDLPEVVERIVNLTTGLRDFWLSCEGWAPIGAAALLGRSRLDWQAQLARSLRRWLPTDEELSDGDLILAWCNLGALVEGALKLFLSVFHEDYADDVEAIRRAQALVGPDALTLEALRQFFARRIWEKGEDWDEWILKIQQRRTAIHAFRDKDIGSFDEFYVDVRRLLRLLRRVNGQLPYPDDRPEPTEWPLAWR